MEIDIQYAMTTTRHATWSRKTCLMTPVVIVLNRVLLPVVYLSNIRQQLAIKKVATHRHLKRVEGVLHDVVGVEVVNAPQRHVNVCLRGIGEEEELCAGEGGEALHAKVFRLEHLEARRRLGAAGEHVGAGRVRRREGRLLDGVEAGCDGVDAAGGSVRSWAMMPGGSLAGAGDGARDVPVKGAREDEVIVCANLLQAGIVKGLVVD